MRSTCYVSALKPRDTKVKRLVQGIADPLQNKSIEEWYFFENQTWQRRRLRSIERPSSWTWRCFRIVSYRFGGGLKLAFYLFDKNFRIGGGLKTNVFIFYLFNFWLYLAMFGGGLKMASAFTFSTFAFTWQCSFPGFGTAGGNLCQGWCSLPGACNTHTPKNILGELVRKRYSFNPHL